MKEFNIMDYGAKCDGSHDDGPALRAAWVAAGGKLAPTAPHETSPAPPSDAAPPGASDEQEGTG